MRKSSFLKAVIYPLLYIGSSLVIAFLLSSFYLLHTYIQNPDTFETIIDTPIYQEQLNHFLNQQMVWTIVFPILFIGIPFYFIYRKKKKGCLELPPKPFETLYYILLGITVSLSYNCACLLFGFSFTPVDNYFLVLFGTVLVGPILEELTFRGLCFETLSKTYSMRTSFWITTVLFAIIHMNIMNMVYAFLIGCFLMQSYIAKNNLWIPITIHIAANAASTFLFSHFLTYPSFLIFCFWLLFTVCLFFLLYLPKMRKKQINI